MMDSIRGWAFSVCFAAVSCGIMQMLVPNISIGKVFRFTVSVFFLICLLSPVMLKNYTPPIITEQSITKETQDIANKLNTSVSNRFEKDAKAKIVKAIDDNLLKIGIKPNKITININTKDKDCILINSVYIELSEKHKKEHEKIVSRLEKYIDITPEIVYIS